MNGLVFSPRKVQRWLFWKPTHSEMDVVSGLQQQCLFRTKYLFSSDLGAKNAKKPLMNQDSRYVQAQLQ